MDFALTPGEQELERGHGINYRGMFDEDEGQYIFTNRRLVHVTNPWYLHPRRRLTALFYLIACLFGYQPSIVTYQVDLNHIASLQYMSYMFTTGYKIRDIYGREVELHVGISSTSEPWRDRLLGLVQQVSPGARILPQGEVIFIQR